MNRLKLRYFALFIIIMSAIHFLLIPVFAHVPAFEEGGKSPDTAAPVKDPTKSRVFYGQLPEGDLQYYSFEVEKGERISLGLIIPVERGSQNFVPDLILMGPGITGGEEVPETVEVPEDYGVIIFSGKIPESATYEGFTPSTFYSVSRADLNAPKSGTYYAAINATEGEGNYGLILGYRESFSLKEWLLIPLNQVKTYRWDGQSLLFIFSPLGIVLIVGILLISLKKEAAARFNPARWAGTFAGLFFLGTGLSYILQMLYSLNRSSYSPEAIITVFLALASIVLGTIALVLSLKDEGYGAKSTRKNFYFSILGLSGLLLWAGLFIGPILAFEAAFLPWRRKR